MKLRYLYPYIYLVRGDRPNPIVAELYPFDKLFIYLFICLDLHICCMQVT